MPSLLTMNKDSFVQCKSVWDIETNQSVTYKLRPKVFRKNILVESRGGNMIVTIECQKRKSLSNVEERNDCNKFPIKTFSFSFLSRLYLSSNSVKNTRNVYTFVVLNTTTSWTCTGQREGTLTGYAILPKTRFWKKLKVVERFWKLKYCIYGNEHIIKTDARINLGRKFSLLRYGLLSRSRSI